jgi:hypothetical protein
MGSVHVVTSPLTLARELFRYGEPALAERAFALLPAEVAQIGSRVADLRMTGASERIWPGGPRNAALLLGVIEHLDGAARPCSRSRRLPEKALPEHLQATEAERWAASVPVSRALDERLHGTNR